MLGRKTVGYRRRPTKVRGPIYIYASLGRHPAIEEAEFVEEVGYEIENLPRGVVVGTVEITDCTFDGDSYEWHLAHPEAIRYSHVPAEHPQPIWFHPFGKP